MKHISAFVFTLVFSASSAFGGLTYEFTSTTTGIANQTIAGNVRAEGTGMRIDIDKGDGALFEDGSFAVSTNGGRTMSVVNPAMKSWYELDLSQLLGGADTLLKQLGDNVKLDVRKPKVSVTGGGSGGTLEGFATKKSTVTSGYEMVIEGLGIPLSMQMELTTDVWWTDQISSDFTNFLQMRGFRTGIAAVDRLIEAEAGAIAGFPLKQVTTTRVLFAGNDMTSTTTSTVKNVQKAAIPASAFAVPAGFQRVAGPLEKMVNGRGR